MKMFNLKGKMLAAEEEAKYREDQLERAKLALAATKKKEIEMKALSNDQIIMLALARLLENNNNSFENSTIRRELIRRS